MSRCQERCRLITLPPFNLENLYFFIIYSYVVFREKTMNKCPFLLLIKNIDVVQCIMPPYLALETTKRLQNPLSLGKMIIV